MHEYAILGDFVVVLLVALAVAWLFNKLRLPTIVGFLAAGVLLGPGVWGFVQNEGEIALLAEVGVVLLLFSIGLELSFKQIGKLGRLVFGAGAAQLVVTSAVFGAIAYAFGFPGSTAAFFGMLGGLSSTAIVLTSLRETDEVASLHGRGMIGVLLFQDLAVVPLVLVVPLLAGADTGIVPLLWTLGKSAGMVLAVWLGATFVFPFFAERVVRARKRELFTLFTAVVAVGTAYLFGAAGLSLALGAFLAGLVISESPYSEQMTADVEPFKDVFNSLFFVSMGLLVDPAVFVESPGVIFGLFGAGILIKAAVLTAVIVLFGYGIRVGILVGLGLSQVGEFSFILARTGLDAGLMTEPQYGLFLGAAILTMAITPLFLRYSSNVASLVADSFLDDWSSDSKFEAEDSGEGEESARTDHVVIVGYGDNGQKLARSLNSFEIDYCIIDLNPQTVRRYEDDEPIHYGDATRPKILKAAQIERATALVVTVADREASRRTVDNGRRLNEDLYIAARTRFSDDIRELYRAGADQVVVEEAETALELVGQTLEAFEVPPGQVLREKDNLRRQGYRRFDDRLPEEPDARRTLRELASEFHTEFVRIPKGSEADGQTIGDLGIRAETGAHVIAVVREGKLVDHPSPDFEFEGLDRVLTVGRPETIRSARALLTE